jgi:hypothetical protein
VSFANEQTDRILVPYWQLIAWDPPLTKLTNRLPLEKTPDPLVTQLLQLLLVVKRNYLVQGPAAQAYRHLMRKEIRPRNYG